MRLPAIGRCLLSIALALGFAQSATATQRDNGEDLHGQPIRELAGPNVRVVVFFFAATDCPISNRYVPEIIRLTQKFGAKGVRIWWVYPNAADTSELVVAHNRDFSISGDAILDKRQSLVALAHATVTPEAAVFRVEGDQLREVYLGRIDDRYLSLGQERPHPQHHDLEEVIADALASKSVSQPGGPPVGCSIVFREK